MRLNIFESLRWSNILKYWTLSDRFILILMLEIVLPLLLTVIFVFSINQIKSSVQSVFNVNDLTLNAGWDKYCF